MTNSTTLKYINKTSALKIFAILFIQQLIAAFGTYALINAGLQVNSGLILVFWTTVALVCHVLTPFLNLITKPMESILSLDAYRNYLQDKLGNKTGRPSLWQQKHQRENFLASIGGETESYLSAIIFVGLDVFSYTTSIILNVLFLGFALNTAFIPAFLASGVLSYLFYNRFKSRVEESFFADQQARTSVFSYLLKSWDNVLLKNKTINQHYLDSIESHLKTAQKKAINSSVWYEGMVAGLSLISSVPVIGVIIYLLVNNQTNTGVLIALLATVPRQLTLLTTFRNAFQTATSFLSFEAKFKSLNNNAAIESNNLSERIQAHSITMNSKCYNTLEDLTQIVEMGVPQRLEVRGVNGAGKSTFLLHLNDNLKSSIYLPANPNFDILNVGVESTGNNLLRHIEHIANFDVTHILLDEWDANLDQENIQKINSILDDLSKSKVIVEVRHR